MSKAIAIITADWHIRRSGCIWKKRPEICGDALFAIDQILALAVVEQAQALVLLGDIFDERLQSADCILMMRQTLDFCAQVPMRCLFVQGQHDQTQPPLLQALCPWVEHMHDRVVEVGGMEFYGLDYQPSQLLESHLATVKAPILMTHQLWQEWMGNRGLANLNMLPAHVRLVFSGDFHRPGSLTTAQCCLLSPGSPYLQDLSEIGVPRKVYVLRENAQIETVGLLSRPAYEEVLTTSEQLDALCDGWAQDPRRIPEPDLPPDIARPLIRVVYNWDLPDATTRLTNTLGPDVHLILDARRVAENTMALPATPAPVSGLEDWLPNFCPSAETLAIARRLWKAQQVRLELEQIVKEIQCGSTV